MGAIEQLPDIARFTDARVRLLTLELEVAMAFVDIARTARIPPSQAKQLRQAWQAYCSIWEMLDEGVDCSPEDRARIQRITDALARTLRDWLDRAS